MSDDEPLPEETSSEGKSSQKKRPLNDFASDVSESFAKVALDVTGFLKKTAEKRFRDIFKDIEIGKRSFLVLFLVGFSFSALIMLGLVNLYRYFSNPIIQLIQSGTVPLGFIIGLLISPFLLRHFKKRYTLLTLLFILSTIGYIIYPIIASDESLFLLQEIIIILNALVIGAILITYMSLVVDSTTIMERGRILALNQIAILFSGSFVVFLIYTQTFAWFALVIPIGTAIFLWNFRGKEKVNLRCFEQPPKMAWKKSLRANKTLIFYSVILFSFGFIIGISFPFLNLGLFFRNQFPSEQVIDIVVVTIFFSAITLFLIGYSYDFLGRRSTIAMSVILIALLNYVQFFLPFDPIVFILIFLLTLMVAVPLIVGDFSSACDVAQNNAGIMLLAIIGIFVGLLLQSFVPNSNLPEATVLFLAIIILGILMNTSELITPKEQLWPDYLFQLYVTHESGMLLYEYEFKKRDLDVESDLISGGIIGLTTMLTEIVRGKKPLRVIDHGDKKILFRYSPNLDVVFVLVVKDDLLVLRNKLKAFSKDFEEQFREKIANMQGINVQEWAPAERLVKKHFIRKYLTFGDDEQEENA